jgi:integrase
MSKRGNNEGTIKQRADGRYESRVTLPDGARKSFYGTTRKEVNDKMTAAMKHIQDGLPVVSERETVGAFLPRWLADTRGSIEPKTQRIYEQCIRLYLVPSLGRIRLARLTPQDVQSKLINDLDARGLSRNTMLNARAVLRKALADAMMWGLVSRNVAGDRMVRIPKRDQTHKRYLTPDEAIAFAAIVAGHRMEAIFIAALGLGLRQGEVLGLRWGDIDFDAGTVRVVNQLQRIDGVLRLKRLKTRTSDSTLPLPAFVADVLKTRRIAQLEERMAAGPYWNNADDLVFTTAIGTPFDPRNVARDFYQLREAAGMPWLTFHGLRHGFGSLLAANGVHPRVAMELMRHSEFRLTMEIYSHVAPDLAKDAANKLDSLFQTG